VTHGILFSLALLTAPVSSEQPDCRKIRGWVRVIGSTRVAVAIWDCETSFRATLHETVGHAPNGYPSVGRADTLQVDLDPGELLLGSDLILTKCFEAGSTVYDVLAVCVDSGLVSHVARRAWSLDVAQVRFVERDPRGLVCAKWQPICGQ
jgi:hypothetical protein